MAHIKTIPPEAAQGELADLYRRVGNPDGTVDHVMMVHSVNPAALRAHFEVYVAAMHRPSPLSRAEREIVGTVVSRLNGCEYCARHHAAGLERVLKGDRPGLPAALLADDHSELTERERAMVQYAKTLTCTPGEMSPDDVTPLRQAGLDDRAVHDLAHVIAYFCYANRIVTGLGVELEGGGIGQHPSV
ncbi:MAG: hypothetical protein D6693_01535 [Planctomycetota bacterium]|nr:MAG: hypothetical protein D6693_01535 [Planctomycetota bacterium]